MHRVCKKLLKMSTHLLDGCLIAKNCSMGVYEKNKCKMQDFADFLLTDDYDEIASVEGSVGLL